LKYSSICDASSQEKVIGIEERYCLVQPSMLICPTLFKLERSTTGVLEYGRPVVLGLDEVSRSAMEIAYAVITIHG
tara:strand:+ start:13995 stop:14222 length:228 start_codon:yes stop_codon:yes gene_type:complete